MSEVRKYLDKWRDKHACIFALSLSPAQEFIEEARKSRDLRAGSLLLSWLSFKLYEPILQHYQEKAFIVPACAGNPFFEEWKKHGGLELEQLKELALGGKSITNRAVGLIEREQLHLLKKTEENCRDAWNTYAAFCQKKLLNYIGKEKWQRLQERWEQQMQDFSAAFSIYAVAADADVTNLPGSIQKIIDQMERRKDSRLFKQWPGNPVQKCTQCGHREILSGKEDSFWENFKAIIRVEGGRELLCACCLAKRIFAFCDIFPSKAAASTMDIAAAPFLEEFCKTAKEKPDDFQLIMWDWQKEVQKHYDRCPEHDSFLDDSWLKKIAEFVLPYELKDDCRRIVEAANMKYLHSQTADDNLGLAPPSPYLAVLMLDGDKMGEHLSKHPQLSDALTEFSQAVPGIIERHQGTAIYSSGDELLALLPKDSALSAAQAVQAKFSSLISETTCSAAITWFHCKDPLQQAIKNCRAGLHEAKETFKRNSLVCTVLSSSGGDHRFGAKWNFDDVDMVAAIEDLIYLLKPEGGLAKNFLHDLLAEFPSFVDAPPCRLFNSGDFQETIQAESDLLLNRMRWLWKRHSQQKTAALCAGEDCCQFLADMASSLPHVHNRAGNFSTCLRVAGFLARN